MPHKTVDVVTLDALIQGEEGPEIAEAWQALLMTPDAANRWDQAVARRATIDRFAMEVLDHPWLASALSRLRRKVQSSSGMAMRIHLEPPSLAALLGPTSTTPDLLTAPAWGDVESISVSEGQVLEISFSPSADAQVRVFYQSRTSQGWMPGRRWKLESGESPVLLMAIVGADTTSDTLDSALSKATLSAGVVVFELIT